ncbi:MAG: efflux RND transporter periplasmic adaptor subunit [Candidatus Tokpelaia sp.]|uniref:efflux RND transporter periplasmic adaptor subunit n=1 Tax=Candidatus Tokpelaia sp. TaxID=2233777 RepID=UPI001239D501|nr:efflux RND transporter periplasmic adaptor subunit [Candidatus Tokpelaia sp.]KAA6205610.1 MAG: efflux RND transporter periplasmic adaptor subunit [Candidatus Tokpelaia sp.]KAA6206284.1 MAG: efflux RND transporter periplasmic adaptor subunit [Candidatus Tokpelaia sp.]KAA6406281.1 efflux transporter periplasmic adaptor subunit [Candidatus Tokpelaia sp.]
MAFFTRKRCVQLFVLIGIMLVLLFGKAWFFGKQTPVYLTVPVKKGDIEATVLATGIVKPHQLVAVGARATGRIVSLKVRPGQDVKQGDLLAEIDPTTQENDLKSKEAVLARQRAGLAEQEAQLTLARQNMQRQQNMIASHAVSRADYDSAAAQVKVAEAEIEAYQAQIAQAEADVDMARVNLTYTQVTAPFSGTILATVVQEGQNVNAVQSAPTIVILGNLEVMTVRAEISEADIVHVKPGQDLYFNTIGRPDRRYNGRLEAIEPAPESIRNDISFTSLSTGSSATSTEAIYYNGLFNVDNKDHALRTYMTAEVHIVLGAAQNVLLVPLGSLSGPEQDGFYHVRILPRKGGPIERKVKIGIKTQAQAEVLSGLTEGDEVITGESGGSGGAARASSSKKMLF